MQSVPRNLCFVAPLRQQLVDSVLTAFFLEDPVELTVVVISNSGHDLLEQASEVVVVRLLFELQAATIGNVFLELFRDTSGKLLHCSLAFLLADLVVFVIFVLASEALPR